jgi:hypothetical protein
VNKKIFFAFFYIFLNAIFSNPLLAQNIRQTSFDDRPFCEQNAGIWRKYGNDCANDCYQELSRYHNCLNKIVYSCDCGIKRCWDGKKCLKITEYKSIFNKLKHKESQEIMAAKNARTELKANHKGTQNSFFNKVVKQVKDGINSFSKDSSSKVQPTAVVVAPVLEEDNNAKANNKNLKLPPAYLEMQKKAGQAQNKNSSNSIVEKAIMDINDDLSKY